ncbi:helix-turn-helix transcriptional regulator [Providencia rettgeri]
MKGLNKKNSFFGDGENLIAKEIGREINRLRRNMGLTGSEVANYLGISQQQQSRYENGVCLIRLDYLLILLHYLETTIDVFFKHVLSNVFKENEEASLKYYNLFFPLEHDIKYPMIK